MTPDFKRDIVRRLSVDLAIPEKTISSVIDWQFSSAEIALKKNSTVEISGIGTFVFSKNSAKRALNKYNAIIKTCTEELNQENISPQRAHTLQLRIDLQKEYINDVNTRMHENSVDENI